MTCFLPLPAGQVRSCGRCRSRSSRHSIFTIEGHGNRFYRSTHRGVQILVLGTMSIRFQPDQFSLMPFFIVYAVSLTTGACYEGFMLGKYGATFGKMACKIQVVTPDGRPISYPRAFGRHFAKWLSG